MIVDHYRGTEYVLTVEEIRELLQKTTDEDIKDELEVLIEEAKIKGIRKVVLDTHNISFILSDFLDKQDAEIEFDDRYDG